MHGQGVPQGEGATGKVEPLFVIAKRQKGARTPIQFEEIGSGESAFQRWRRRQTLWSIRPFLNVRFCLGPDILFYS